MKDPYDIWKTLTLVAVMAVMAMCGGCANTTPSARVDCVTWTKGDDPRYRSHQNTECKSRQRTQETLRRHASTQY